MITALSLMVLTLIDGSEERTLMQSHRCRMDILMIRTVLEAHPELPPRTVAGVEIVEFRCVPFRMGAMS